VIATRKRRVVVAAAASVIGLLAALGGYAFWNLTGSGTATTAVGTATDGSVTLTATIADGIYPGSSMPVTYKASNSSTTASVTIGTVSVTGITADAGHSGCDTSDFAVAPVVQNQLLLPNATNVTLPNTGTLTYANTALDQNACKGATLTLTLSST
jgi:hypothetical protein